MDSRFNINISDVAKMSPLQEEILRNFQSFQPFCSPKSLVCLMEVASNSPIPHWLADTGDFAPPHRLHQAAVGSAEFFLVSCTHLVGV